MTIKSDSVLLPSNDLIAKEVDEEFIIVVIKAGVSNIEDDLFSLNDTGEAIWNLLDGKRTVSEVIEILKSEYQATDNTIEQDVFHMLDQLLQKNILIEIQPD
jgi:coenzyme PQQ biosynthesis protein PqqD